MRGDSDKRLASILKIMVRHAVQVSIAVVDDPTIHELNRRFLQHDYPTDVLSFVLEQQDGRLEGEVIVSTDTAVAQAGEYGVQPGRRVVALCDSRSAASGRIR